jgi:hypothetical protein
VKGLCRFWVLVPFPLDHRSIMRLDHAFFSSSTPASRQDFIMSPSLRPRGIVYGFSYVPFAVEVGWKDGIGDCFSDVSIANKCC